ncbi:hypothetical protein [Streptacidiphilus sp. MAP12-33]|uniref:hypothetical protein n=1 Tax=Streptacidiphilus sp. MAP12-33 TaxID=3156266 RepID=UPI0035167048
MTHENAWIQADIHFKTTTDEHGRRTGGQQIDDTGVLKVQAGCLVQFADGWLHLKPNAQDPDHVVSIPATAVDRVYTRQS